MVALGGFFQLSGLEPPPASVKRTLNFRSLALQLVLPLDDLPEGWSESLATLSVGDVSVFALRSGFRPFLPLGTNLLSGVTVSTGYGTLPVGMGVDLRISDATMPVPEAAVDKGRGAGSGARLVLKGTLRSLLAPGIPVLTIPTHMKVTAEIAITPDSGNLPNRLFSLSLKDFKLRPGPLEAASPSHQASVALIKSFVRSKFEDYLAGGGSGSSANGLAATLNASVLGRLNSVTIPAAVATVPPNRRVAWLFRSAANIQIAGVKGLLLQATGLWYAGAEEENLGFFPVGR